MQETPDFSTTTAPAINDLKDLATDAPEWTGADFLEADEQSLDPSDWDEFRRLGHAMLDAAMDNVQHVRDRPVWRPVPDAIKNALREELPTAPQGAERVCSDILSSVLPFSTGNTHPRFFGWVHGSGTAGGMLAELMSASMNANVGGREHSAVYVERTVIEWCRQLFDFPQTSSGLLVSGTSMATLIGLTVARNHLSGYDVRKLGVQRGSAPLVAYTSSEGHSSIAKAFELLGLGSDALRAIPVDDSFCMRIDALREAIDEDRRAGLKPFCVIGTAGTVNTGAIDDLSAIADVCAEEDLWFHVDGAFGAASILHDELKPRVVGIERADSLAFDFHKWLHVQYDAACVLIRREDLHREAFSSRREYLAAAPRGLASGNPWFCEYGPELSRGFRALKVWFTLKEHGVERLGQKVHDNCQQALYLSQQVLGAPRLELVAPVSLNIVCFRYVDDTLSAEELDDINGEIVADLQEQGIAAPSTTRLNGALAIRVNITNHRSQREDFDLLVEAVLSLGETRARG